MTYRPPAPGPATDADVLELAEHAVVLRRPAAELQVGLDPHRALVLAAAYEPVLRRLHGPTPLTGLLTAGRSAGLSARDVTRVVRQLRTAGLLRSGTTVPPDRAGRRVRLVGAGPVGLPLARYLVEGGVGELAVFDARPPDVDLYPGPHADGDQAGALVAAVAYGRTRVVPLTHWSKPETSPVDLTVVVADGPEVDRLVTDHLVRTDQPHLVVRSLGTAVWVGPLVLPGRTPCVRCTDLTRTDADPGWPAVLAQLARVRLRLPALLTGWSASVAAAQALAFLDGGRPETLGATLELAVDDLRTERRSWPGHAECGCRWPTSTEWGP